MANVTKPMALDESLHTTESTPRNLADVLAEGLEDIANNVKPDGSDISIDVPGMSATNVDDGFSELKQSLDSLIKTRTVTNTSDASGNVFLGQISDMLILGVCPDRTVNPDVLSSFLTTTANGISYMAKCVNANLQPVSNVSVGIKVTYI